MEEKVKQRLIGVIVVIGALFIILPFLFHNSRPSVESTLSTNAPKSGVSVTLPAVAATAANNNATPQTTPSSASTVNTASASTTQTTQTTQTADASSNTTTTPTSDATAQNQTATSTVTAANNSFSAAPNALTTGQANEGPAQPAAQGQPAAQVQSASASQTTTQAQASTTQTTTTPALKSHHTAMKQEPLEKRLIIAKQHDNRKIAANTDHGAWEIQLAVFSDKTYANNLVAKLQSHHFDVHSRHIIVNNRPLVAVLVGPEINLNKAEVTQHRLKQEFNLNGVIKKNQA